MNPATPDDSTRVASAARRDDLLRGVTLGALAVFVAGALLYVVTMAPTVLWGDDAELQRIVVTREPRVIGQSSGASHLLWLAVTSGIVRGSSWLPLDPAGRATLVTALFGALALAFVCLAGAGLASPLVVRP